MTLKPGSRWKSVVCNAEVVVVRASAQAQALECGGHPMAAHGDERPGGLALAADRAEGIQVGKRYFDEETGTEVLCSKAGAGSLSMAGRPLQPRAAKQLPASD
ncbi:MAG TPA: hypothetical protein VHY32_11125 [Caulobacteraceae bacterium]|jgi:hypothetical protein|nr:hypothetical protein [Caulobacteraceae bacterium]